MKGLVQFPFRVKLGGEYYGPQDPVEVDDVDEAVSQGAKILNTYGEPEQPPKQGGK